MPDLIVLSYYEVKPLLKAREAGRATANLSPDLGLTVVEVALSTGGVTFPDGEELDWQGVEDIARSETKCFHLNGSTLSEIRVFSEMTGRVCSLYPTGGCPTMVIGGFPMHRIKGTDPHQDTIQKVKAAAPIVGNVLDTTTGLGYTAIEAAHTASSVTTVELDPASLDVARLNPWSQELFGNPKIKQLMGNSFDVIQDLPDGSFTRIIHDPPTFSLAGELYSGEFYRHCYRVLTRGGRLFHYTGNLKSGEGGQVSRGAIKRLKEAGFARIVPKYDAFGVVAFK
ncbi:MAG: methyltransferase [Chloroflexota bacterium]